MNKLENLDLDALTELVNMGVGRAANALNELTESHSILKVPSLEIFRFDEIDKLDQRFGMDPVAAVLQNFHGSYKGRAALIFPTESALNLVTGVTGEEPEADDLDAIQSGTLAEIGNIVINALIGTIGNILGNRLEFDLSEYFQDTVANLLKDSTSADISESFILISEVHFIIEKLDISGHIILTFDIDSLEALFLLINQAFDE
jgi:chemotaxis protein CheC